MEITVLDYTFDPLWTAIFAGNMAAWVFVAFRVLKRFLKGWFSFRLGRSEKGKGPVEAAAPKGEERTASPVPDASLTAEEKKFLEMVPAAKPVPTPAPGLASLPPQKEIAPPEAATPVPALVLDNLFLPGKGAPPEAAKPSLSQGMPAAEGEKQPGGGMPPLPALDIAGLMNGAELSPKPAAAAPGKAAGPPAPSAKEEKQVEVKVRKVDSVADIFASAQPETNAELRTLTATLEEIDPHELLERLRGLAHEIGAISGAGARRARDNGD